MNEDPRPFKRPVELQWLRQNDEPVRPAYRQPQHEIVAIAAPYSFGGNCLEWEGFRVLPCARDGAGNDVISRNHEATKADLTLTLADVFGLLKAAQAGVLSQFPWPTGFRWTRTLLRKVT